MSKFTPAPWRWASLRDTSTQVPDGRQKVIIGSNNQGFCHTVGLTGAPEEDTANAQLISAAPDMYQALRGFQDAMRSSEKPDFLKLVNALHEADAAIQKAEGRND